MNGAIQHGILGGTTFYGTTDQESTGETVDISSDGDTIVYGSPKARVNGIVPGSVNVYDWDGSAWVPKGDTFW